MHSNEEGHHILVRVSESGENSDHSKDHVLHEFPAIPQRTTTKVSVKIDKIATSKGYSKVVKVVGKKA